MTLPTESNQEIIIPNHELALSEKPLTIRINETRQHHRMLPSFIVSFSISQTVSEALKRIRMSRSWWDSLSPDVQTLAIDLADEMRLDPLMQAKEIVHRGLVDAAIVKMRGLTSTNEGIAQRAATEILDRGMGKPNQPSTKDVHVEIFTNLPFLKGDNKNGKDIT